ncbi:MAG: hypothetical protein U1E39_12455 [Planctomycetota bacterium]
MPGTCRVKLSTPVGEVDERTLEVEPGTADRRTTVRSGTVIDVARRRPANW